MGSIRRTVLLYSAGLYALVAFVPGAGFAAPLTEAQTALLAPQSPERKAQGLVQRARTLVSNAIPEERPIAEQLLIEATRLCAKCVEAYSELGRMWLTEYSMGRAGISSIQRAASMAELVKQLSPESPLGEYMGVEVLLTIGRQSEAFRLYSLAKQEFPDHIETLAFEARLWAEVDPDKALASAQNALSRGYSLQELSPWIGNALVKAVGDEQSGEALARFAAVYPDRWLWHRAALSFASHKKWKEARAAFQKAIQLGNNLESPLQLAIIEYKEMGMAKEASARLAALGKVVRQSKTLGFESQALVESHTAFAFLMNQELLSAKLHAESALDLSVNNESRITQIIDFFRSKNQLHLISDGLNKIVLNNPLLEDVHLALAMLTTNNKEYAKTLEHLSAAIALSPERDDLYSARGQAAYLATQYEIALQDFDTAIRQKPDHAPYHYNRACLLSLLGRISEAYESLKIALVMNQELRDHALSDSDLENLRLDKNFETRLAQIGIPMQLMSNKKNPAQIIGPSDVKSSPSQWPATRNRPGKPD